MIFVVVIIIVIVSIIGSAQPCCFFGNRKRFLTFNHKTDFSSTTVDYKLHIQLFMKLEAAIIVATIVTWHYWYLRQKSANVVKLVEYRISIVYAGANCRTQKTIFKKRFLHLKIGAASFGNLSVSLVAGTLITLRKTSHETRDSKICDPRRTGTGLEILPVQIFQSSC